MAAALANIPLRLHRAQAAMNDSVASTAQTARIMCEHIRRDSRSPIVQRVAQRIAATSGATDAASAAAAVWLYVKQAVSFEQDDVLIRRLLNEGDQLELLIAPAALLSMHNPEGDCDDFTMLCCALLSALGVRAQVVCLCCDVREPSRFSHVYARAFIPEQNRWLAVDASHGTHPGWKVPARDTFREQDYDLNGHCAADVVTARPALRAPIRGSAPSGLGDAPACKPWEGLVATGARVDQSSGGLVASVPELKCGVSPGSVFLLPAHLLGVKSQDMISTNQIAVSVLAWAALGWFVLKGGK